MITLQYFWDGVKWLLKWLSRVWASASAAGGGKFVGQPGVAEFVSARNLVGFEPGEHKREVWDILDGWATTRLA